MLIEDIISESKEIRTQKRNNGFTVDLYDDGKHIGQYTHAREDDIVRNQAEIFPEYRNKGYGTMLLLAAIKTANDLGLDFEEDTYPTTSFNEGTIPLKEDNKSLKISVLLVV